MDPSQRKRLVHWEQAARRSIALLRARSDRYADEIWFEELITDLYQASPEFRTWWSEHNILFTCHDQNEMNHPLIGSLAFQGTTLVMPEHPDLQIMVHIPLSKFDTTTKLKTVMTEKRWHLWDS